MFTPSISERRSSTTTYYHNGFKNAESQTIANETVSATQTFDAFGLPDTSSGSWNGPFGYGGPHGYQSDSDSGLKLLGHRYYDSSTGRFLTRDVAKDGWNWYVYCDSNPVIRADPHGQPWWFLPLLIGGLTGGLLTNAEGPSSSVDKPAPPPSFDDRLNGFVGGATAVLGFVFVADMLGGGWAAAIGAGAVGGVGTSSRPWINKIADDIIEWLGPGAKVKPSKTSYLVIVSDDEKRIIHFDLSKPKPHINPHVDVLDKDKGKFKVWPKDVDRR